ncbi:molybdopterin-dependent oxidoreductase [Nocardia amamiensis]|uniref:molybdopterin-dependent oxidoreductase n=1 Tax=Nocardia amamiensis TaxID=404578 RepID=UPI0008356CB6|nr:molybdopterin-dependent oxidoreductase [Nocardia amamiensis]
MAEIRLRVGAGIVSAGLALGVAELLAAFAGSGSAPLNALGSAVVDHTPDGLREWAITTFGTNDKAVLYLIMGVFALVVAGLAGAVERGTRTAGSWLFVAFAVIAAGAAMARTGVGGALPTVIGVAVGIYTLRVLTRRIDRTAERPSANSAHSATQTAPATDGTAGGREDADAAEARRGEAVPAADATDTATLGDRGEAVDAARATHDVPAAGATDTATPEDRGAGDVGAAGATVGFAQVPDVARAPATAGQFAVRHEVSQERAEARTEERRPERRQVLQGLLVAGGLAVVTGVGGRLLGLRRRDVSGERAAVQLPEPTAPAAPVPPGADLRIPGLTPYVTSNDDFYRIDTALIVPQVSKDDWSLRIHGMVDREIRLSWADLAHRPVEERMITLACVSNPVGGDLIGNARWLGYRLDQLLAEAGPHPDADMVLSHSTDGWNAGTPLTVLTDGRDALLAVGMNGEPLPVQHGYPARLVVPGLYGYVSATKWVTELEVTRFDRATAYWTRRGWSALGPIKTGTRIDTPRGRKRLAPGRIPIAGVAWAQHRGIRAVEVQIDDGPWQQARLSDEQSIDTWRQWVLDWDATTGPHTIRARTTDGTDETQTAERRDVIPDGATGYPAVTVQVG